MLKYLIVLLDDLSVSFCHYPNNEGSKHLISLNALKGGLIWAMKENLMVQFVYPDYELPQEYYDLIDTIDHIDIKRDNIDADVSIFDGTESYDILKNTVCPHAVLRVSKNELFRHIEDLEAVISKQSSLNIVITDIESFSSQDFESYKTVLKKLSSIIERKIKAGIPINTNVLTDRLALTSMNNCNAGDENITLAPDGNFYICPAFYHDNESSIGNPMDGLQISNNQLYKLEYSPVCRICDAYQCKRCVWLNHKLTHEVNIPGREQCIISHLERNASRSLLERMKHLGNISTNISIPEIDYIDPFEKISK